ncbi:MAG: LytTR family transcriptional regulator [Rhodobacteraceae bacterium]|nr:MAG: LytTR family transcriptional regulator [Paracoccaceae bacterium]
MRQTLADIWAGIGWERKIVAFFGGVLVLALTGPFGTYAEMGFAERLVFWLIVFTGVGFFMHVCLVTALGTPYLGRVPPVLRLGLGAGLAALPGAAVVIFVDGVFRPPLDSAGALPVIWLQVALVGWVLGIVEFHDFGKRAPAPEAPRRAAFCKRLPPELGQDIISISMQDHYAEVTTTQGTHLLLMRMSDAMRELEGAPGLQLHRSHYAMTAHLRKLHRDGARLRVRLSDGRDLPVSASHAEAVRRALRQERKM